MNFNVKCIRGPFWLPDEYEEEGYVDEVFGYECTLNGKQLVMGEDNIDDNYYVQVADNKTYDLYIKYARVLRPIIQQAIESFKIKSNLSDDTRDTFNDLLN